jgi:hypothetical protein
VQATRPHQTNTVTKVPLTSSLGLCASLTILPDGPETADTCLVPRRIVNAFSGISKMGLVCAWCDLRRLYMLPNYTLSISMFFFCIRRKLFVATNVFGLTTVSFLSPHCSKTNPSSSTSQTLNPSSAFSHLRPFDRTKGSIRRRQRDRRRKMRSNIPASPFSQPSGTT